MTGRHLHLTAGFLLVLAGSARGQELSGRIQTSTDTSAIAGALVIMVDSLGREVSRTLSSPSGGFTLRAGTPGAYQVRVLRIGYAGWLSPPVRLAANQRQETRFLITDRVIQLAEIEVRAAPSRCGVRPGDSDVIARLLNEAEKALAITEQTITEGNLRFRTEIYLSRPTADGAIGERRTATAAGQASWPVASAPPESLAVWGFVHDPGPRTESVDGPVVTGPVYYAPDARVLFSDWFLAGHCFSVVAPPADSGSTVVVDFIPENGLAARGDIWGRLTLDRSSLELRQLDYWYTGLGRWVVADSSGGSLSFRRVSSGGWIINRWVIRAPIPMVGRTRRDTTLFGFAESGGRVTEVRHGRSGMVERISVLNLPWTRDALSDYFQSPLMGRDLCAHHGGCWADLSSFLSSAPDESRPRFVKLMARRRNGDRDASRPARISIWRCPRGSSTTSSMPGSDSADGSASIWTAAASSRSSSMPTG